MKKYCIIGASAAGLACAEQIRKEDAQAQITVFSDESYLPYSRPSISYYLKGAVKQKDMFLRTASYYKQQNIQILTDSAVSAIIPEKKTVKVGRKEYAYDTLCICTGSKPFVPPMKHVDGKENALTFLTLADTKKVKARANAGTRAVVIGAGLIGMKAAEGLSKICKSVDVVELSERILPSILDITSSKSVKAYVEQQGHLRFHLGDTVSEAKTKGNRITSVRLKSGRELPCDILVIAVGVRPELALAQAAGIETDRGILTDRETMRTSVESIYAAGDCTVSTDMLDGSKKIIALWPNAVNQGTVSGSQMAGGDLKMGAAYAVNAIDFYGLRICTCGLINAAGEQYTDKIRRVGDQYKRLIFEGNHLVGYVLINAGENAGIYTNMIEQQTDITTLEGDIFDTPSLFIYNESIREKRLKGELQ